MSDRLAMQVVGPIDHSRWLTLSGRTLQIYTKTTNHSPGLSMIVQYIYVRFMSDDSDLRIKSSIADSAPKLIDILAPPSQGVPLDITSFHPTSG